MSKYSETLVGKDYVYDEETETRSFKEIIYGKNN